MERKKATGGIFTRINDFMLEMIHHFEENPESKDEKTKKNLESLVDPLLWTGTDYFLEYISALGVLIANVDYELAEEAAKQAGFLINDLTDLAKSTEDVKEEASRFLEKIEGPEKEAA